MSARPAVSTRHHCKSPFFFEWSQSRRLSTLAGRPQPKNLSRRTLEQALSETAVVVCGPQGLVSNVRQSVVSLSDERSVHKGTGAQGIYLYAEAFEY